jgi:hypothetical protein
MHYLHLSIHQRINMKSWLVESLNMPNATYRMWFVIRYFPKLTMQWRYYTYEAWRHRTDLPEEFGMPYIYQF